MAKVQVIRRNRVFNVDVRLAPLLEQRGGYLRRDMQAQPAAVPPAKPPASVVKKPVAAGNTVTKKKAAKKKVAAAATPTKDATE